MNYRKYIHDKIKRNMRRKSRVSFTEEQVVEITKPGMYWFTPDDGSKWLAQILPDGTATKLEVGAKFSFAVDSLGIGEFVSISI